MLDAVRLGLAISKRLAQDGNKKECMQTILKAIGDDSKLSVIQWATIGKRLGVFDSNAK